MRAVAICRPPSVGTLFEAVPIKAPPLLPICNKPLAEYHLDLFGYLGATRFGMVTLGGSADIKSYFGKGEKWGITIDYTDAAPGADLAHLLSVAARLASDEDLMVTTGLIFPHFDRRAVQPLDPAPFEGLTSLTASAEVGENLLLIPRRLLPSLTSPEGARAAIERGVTTSPWPVAQAQILDSITTYHALTLEILTEQTDAYDLPGYSIESHVRVGMGAATAPSAHLEPPLALGNDCRIGAGVRFVHGVVVGDNVYVGDGVHAERSIFLAQTYVGEGLHLVGKIVAGQRVIDAATGIWADIQDATLLAGTTDEPVSERAKSCLDFLLGLPLLLLQAIPCLLLAPMIEREWHRFIGRDHNEHEVIRFVARKDPGLFERAFFRLSLHQVPYLIAVLRRQLSLCGNRPAPANAEGNDLIDELPAYYPAAFSYPAMLGSEPHQRGIDDLYYAHHATIGLDLEIFWGGLIQNLAGDRDAVYPVRTPTSADAS